MRRNPVAWAALIVASAALFSSAGFLRPMPAAPKVTEEGQRAAKALSQAFGAVAEFARPSVVQISVQKKGGGGMTLPRGMRRLPTPNRPGQPGDPGQDLEEMLRRFFNPESGPQREQFGNRVHGIGSGFVYDNHGHILTNNHVVEDSEKITVTFWDGVEAKATFVGTDKRSDVAVIKVDNTSYPPLPKGDSSKLKVGELVMAVGSPFELSQSVTTGIVSALERNAVGINEYESFIQTDAPINRGNSGGPLVNMDGEAIGINSAIVSGSSGNDGIGFTIPINMAASVANMLIKDGKVHYARVGIVLAPLEPRHGSSARARRKYQGRSGQRGRSWKPGGESGPQARRRHHGFCRREGPERSVVPPQGRHERSLQTVGAESTCVTARRNQRPSSPRRWKRSCSTSRKMASQAAVTRAKSDPATTSIGDFGLEVQPLTAEIAKPLGLPDDTKGLLVHSIKEGGPAEAAGIEQGDVITKIIRNRKLQSLTSVKDFQDVASKSDELAIYVQKGKLGRFVTLKKDAK